MAIDHFSHEHKLNLEEVKLKGRDKFKCEVCDEQISSSEEVYCCRDCKFFLHQVCSKHPQEITHQIHPHHPLRLVKKRSDGISCDSCCERCNGINYYCEPCDFDLHIQCSFPQEILKFGHVHHHPLIFQTRIATFVCNFCRVEDKDQSYQCYTCPFWIHKKCGSMPLTNLLNFHPHPLSLVQGVPEETNVYDYACQVCNFIPKATMFLYYCGPCRYLVHIKCIKTITDQIQAYYSAREYYIDYIEDSFFKYIFNDDLLHLPADNISVDLIQRFLVDKNSLIDVRHQIQIFSHKDHPLILITEQMVNNDEFFKEEDEEILCDGCIQPITAPYYHCKECNYYIHVPCAYLPSKLQHPAHTHKLNLFCKTNFWLSYTCNNCCRLTNGFVYGCRDCKFYLDLKCAALPTLIMHEAHEHPLIQENAIGNEICKACNSYVKGGANLVFQCKPCNFNLHHLCALLPKSFRHRWDRNHPIRLRFPPHYEHPGHIMCDMCEQIIHPKRWLYSCAECKVSFHLYCPPRLHKYPNMKYGHETQRSTHLHPLQFLRQPTLKTSCDACRKDIVNTNGVFECQTCYDCMCNKCALAIV